jgi:hypothetical protein
MIRGFVLLVFPLTLVACSGGGGGSAQTSAPPPTTAPPGSPLDVASCLFQQIGPGQPSVANIVVPDTIKVDLTKPSGFPNGRRLTDSVIDTELAWIFLDLTKHDALTLTRLPLGPQENDKPFRSEFPYLAEPHGGTPAATGGSNFQFRTETPSAYVQVDRMGLPAIATALIGSSAKNAYNDDSPAGDASTKYVKEIKATLAIRANALQDDFAKAGLSICAKPVGPA